MKAILQALGYGSIAATVIGGIVIAVSLLDHRVEQKNSTNDESIQTESRSNQPVETEKIQYMGWEDIDKEFFDEKAEFRNKYTPCYCTVYSDDYMAIDIPIDGDNSEFKEIVIEPWKSKEQSYIPYDYTTVPGYYLDNNTGRAWSVKMVDYEFLSGFLSRTEGDTVT